MYYDGIVLDELQVIAGAGIKRGYKIYEPVESILFASA